MDHREAIQQMAAERYLLDEMTPELRESFEEHAFDCPECSMDLRAGAAFITAAKAELPGLVDASPSPSGPAPKPAIKKSNWFIWLRPAFAIPAFAALLAVIAYQNLATIPALRSAGSAPQILPSTGFHAGTRGTSHTSVLADRKQGLVLSIQLPQDSAFASYAFDFSDPQGKQLWTRAATASDVSTNAERTISLVIPGQDLKQSSYTLSIFGITTQGTRTEIDRRILEIHFDE